MTRERYGRAYEKGLDGTVRFLLSRGVLRDTAVDIAQSAWLRGWERLDQLRDERILATWVNTIALNYFRKLIRYERRHQGLQETPDRTAALNWAAIDVSRILSGCKARDRALLEAQLEGVTVKELSSRTGASPTAIRIRLLRARRAARDIARQAARKRLSRPLVSSRRDCVSDTEI
ncbi:MAG: polymerase sigma factor [Bryobacterales bacterium]|nr:polymerase sigma factor [Bryobacterales bacterium]